MKIRSLFLLFLACFPLLAPAQSRSLTSGEIAAGIAKLGTSGRVLYLAAHPDDENTRLLAYLAKEKKVRTGYLSLTRGDGGQNLIGNEQAELLGLIRTQELLAARRVDGAEQFFTRANDFGFSKNPDESFKIWGKEQILADVVWVIRNFKPDIIITRFPEDARAGHGHHSGSAILAREAFYAAADPSRFPEQLQQVKPWQARRLVWNTFNFGGNNTTAPDQLKMNIGLWNPLLGMSYGEIAAISRTHHKSQGFGSALQRGEAFEYFSPVAGEPAKTDLFEGISTVYTWKEKDAEKTYLDLVKNFNHQQPSASLLQLLKLRTQVKDPAFNRPLLDELILAAAGIWADVNSRESSYAYGEDVPVKIQAIQRTDAGSAVSIALSVDGKAAQSLASNQLFIQDTTFTTRGKDVTQPYWLKEEHPIGQYHIDGQQWVGAPENPDKPALKLEWILNGQRISTSVPVTYKYTDPIRGERYQPLVIAPPVTATLSEKVYLFTGDTSRILEVNVKNFSRQCKGSVKPVLPQGWTCNPAQRDFSFARKGDEEIMTFDIIPPKGRAGGELTLEVLVNGEKTAMGLHTIHYDHIPTLTLFPPAKARLEKTDLKTAGRNIAYIEGAGDLVADALKQMGYNVSLLTVDQLSKANLSAFDAIVTGVRLYNIREEMKIQQPRLLQYVEQGGTLLVQYNVNNGLKVPDIGPWPFKLVNKRVTEEDAPVTFLNPDDAALNYPNKISKTDFEGWIQERGLYFASDIDPHYRTPLNMADTGESLSNGSLLVADYGKGKFVYTSLVFFRELPAGVPGAYRLFANLIAPKPASSNEKPGK